jgi:hypothetical protein
VLRLLSRAGTALPVDMPVHCLNGLGYACPIAHQIYRPDEINQIK